MGNQIASLFEEAALCGGVRAQVRLAELAHTPTSLATALEDRPEELETLRHALRQVRLEFEDEMLVSLRRFDPLSQRSVEQMREATVLPRYEIALSPGEAAEVLERLAQAGDRAAEAAAREGRDIERMTSELFFEGMERVAGHYGQDLTSFWSYVPEDAFVWTDEPERLAERGERLDQVVVPHHDLRARRAARIRTQERGVAGCGRGPSRRRAVPAGAPLASTFVRWRAGRPCLDHVLVPAAMALRRSAWARLPAQRRRPAR